MQYGDDQAPDVLVLARWQTDHGVALTIRDLPYRRFSDERNKSV